MFEAALQAISKYDTIIIHRHSKPDGDALGSQIGLKHIIKTNYPDKRVYAVGDDAKRYSFMDDSEMDVIDDSVYCNSLAILLDMSSASLVSDDRYKNAEMTVRFDHHLYLESFTDIEYVNTAYESCAGLIADFAIQNKLKMNDIAAKSLFTGMVTDSGRFRYDSTTSDTFRIASYLMNYNFSASDIYADLYCDDFDKLRLRAMFVLKIQFTTCNVAYIYTTEDELKSINSDAFSISRGMVGTMSDIKGVNIWVNFTESDGKVLCEIRSSKYNINPIAVKYGGGGHAKASGVTLESKEQAMMLLNDLNKITESI